MSHIFISYSHKDKTYVHKLQEALQKEGFEVWIDDRIDYGEEWPAEIEWRLDNCEAFIVVVSSNAKKSKWVQNEVRRAERKELPMFPLLLEGEPWLYIETIQWFDVTKGNIPDEKFFRRLANFANRNRPVVAEEPKPVPVQKSPRKWDTRIIAAIASIVVIFAAIFGLPWNKWFVAASDIATVTPTNTATFIPSQPTLTKTKALLTSTFTPASPTKTETPTFTPTTALLPEEIIDDKGITMRLVPAGTFMMGSEQGYKEKPIHEVYLDTYYMDIYEVTNAAYKLCVSDGVCELPRDTNTKYNKSRYDNHPVVYVDWDKAKAYCTWRGARLPTEAEWEKAARGTDGRTYPWGEEEINCGKANYGSNCFKDTTPVGTYENGKSPYGMYDMIGNVWEWVNDWYDDESYYDGDYYQKSPFSNPLGPAFSDLEVIGGCGAIHVYRGGSWQDYANVTRRSVNLCSYSASDENNTGFRCARDANP
jgi:formylglycine-generating enzyme required for sulfatase activity